MKYPSFLIVGAQRSGTTALRKNLNRHPSVEVYQGEICFFQPKNFSKGFDWYLSHFNLDKEIFGEKCPMYMYKSLALKNIYDTLPNIKLIAVLRNPVTRAISQYVKAIKTGASNSSMSLDSLIDRDIKNVEEGRMETGDGVLQRGIYSYQIQNIMRFFKKEQLQIIISDDLVEKPHQVYSSIFDWLGVSTDISFILNEGKYVKVDNKLDRRSWGDISISQETVERLISFYRPYNDVLESIIDRDLTRWKFED